MATPSSNMDKSDVDMAEIYEEGADLEAGVIGALDSPKVSLLAESTLRVYGLN